MGARRAGYCARAASPSARQATCAGPPTLLEVGQEIGDAVVGGGQARRSTERSTPSGPIGQHLPAPKSPWRSREYKLQPVSGQASTPISPLSRNKTRKRRTAPLPPLHNLNLPTAPPDGQQLAERQPQRQPEAHYNEGDSVPYRPMKLAGLTPGSHTVIIEWDAIEGGKHALDYLTTYNRTEADASPGRGRPAASPPACPPHWSIPKWTRQGLRPKTRIAGSLHAVRRIAPGLSDTTSTGYSYDGGRLARISITFTATGLTNPSLAWAGHIATRQDWGADNSAVAISGSPFHMRFLALDGSGGNQDRSLSSEP